MNTHKVDHASFTLDRHYDAPVALLYVEPKTRTLVDVNFNK